MSIVALSTPAGRSAVAVVRMSGENSIEIAKKVFSPFPKSPNLLKVGNLDTGDFVERAMCVYFEAPKSFTGENMVEFHCHGGMAIVTSVIQVLLDNGARMAQNGEFSKRAFINGKMNLSETEGVIEMIDAETTAAVKAGENLLANNLGKKSVALQDKLLDLIAKTEVALDYPEEDLEEQTLLETQKETQEILDEIEKLLSTVKAGKIAKYGIDVAIAGETNVGKSSLLNALLGYDRAIVSSTAGTTRDTLDAHLTYKDTKFNFVDTAGIRQTDNEIERLGIDRAKKTMKEADLVLFVVNGKPLAQQEKTLYVLNKCDEIDYSNVNREDCVVTSAKDNKGIEELKEKIYKMFCADEIYSSGQMLTNARHVDCLNRAKEKLQIVVDNLFCTTVDCSALNIRDAWSALGEITGTTATEEIIDRIYSKFCLGK
ncbi:MAG: tRNA uridine-5-carboxymethylaminomethyl(34) synthesis GTPase MnmE [Clostridia bacterium]|nr:tRNA uridine-5-carboxymethylaminomethyl(34) synthesis GTPase MnmE [Clostridia bacterium]